ncbi:efflux RND transporter periplasmic adaptor subunit [Blastopirellula marina]|uniref:Efflux RND transporter periplasmic adaptor subunit n=1 Tax=Blastopirellula marina TaxID=124 RepID=A0A2S8GK71_9BACT|nr:efflux RND transporter periplasmic adaptor subunit [Blastopirellula marina]PQO44711.1 efflux RND transporter periplasmic adaptor subunit [Blastopirellula marina]
MFRRTFCCALIALAGAVPALAQRPASPVVVQRLVEADVAATQPFVGTVMPRRQATIGSAVAGRVSEFYFEEGDAVKAGEPIAQILTETIKLQIAAAKAELALRDAELAELKNGNREEEIAQSKAEMMSSKARMEYLKARRDRTVDLYETRRVSSKEERDEAVSAAEAAMEAFKASEAAYNLMLKGARDEKILQAQARVDVQKAVVGELEDRLNKYTIRSRFDGYISRKHTDVGAWAEQGAQIVDVVELDEVEITAFVAEHHVTHIPLGIPVQVRFDAIPTELVPGEVVAIVPQADVRTRTFPVKIRVKNREQNGGPLLKAGMLARVPLPTAGKKKGLLCPKDALVLNDDKAMVYVTVEEPGKPTTVKPVPVELGVAIDEWIEVIGDVNSQTKVVTEGNERLRPGQPISVLEETDARPFPTSTSESPR